MPGVPIFSNSSAFEAKNSTGFLNSKSSKNFFSISSINSPFIIFIFVLSSAIFYLILNQPKISTIVHLRQTHPDYVERPYYTKLIWEKLKAKDDSPAVVALYGEGGIGKSELAIAYGNSHLKDYSLIHWIDAASLEGFRKSYEILSEDLNIEFSKQDQTELIIRKVHRYLESHKFKKPWLLIYDNADQEITMPQRGNGTILITTRNADLWNTVPSINILPLTQAEGEKLFAKVIGAPSSPERLQVFEKLDHLPLALTLAAHYIAETPGMSEKDYLELLDKSPLLFIENFSKNERCANNLISSWKMVLEQLYHQDRDVWSCLHLFGFLSPDSIPQDWIEKWLEYKDPSTDSDDLKVKAHHVLHILVSRGLVSQHQKLQSISIHRLKQHCMQFDNYFTPEYSDEVLAFLVRNYEPIKFYDVMERSFELWEELSLWEPSAVCFLKNYKGNAPENLAKLQTLVGNWKCLKGDYQEALILHDSALKVRETLLGRNHPEVPTSLNNLAWSHWKCGSYDLSISLYEKATSIFRDYFGEDHLEMTFVTNNLSLVLIDLGKFKEAKEINQTNLEIRKKHFGPNNVNTANSTLNLAWAMLKLGEVNSAIEHYNLALETYLKLYGENHPYVAICSHHLARALCEEKNYSEARILLESAMNFYSIFYGKNHPYMAIAQNGLAEIYEKLEMPRQAFEAHFCAFDISLQALKLNHPNQSKYFFSMLKLLENPELTKINRKLKKRIYLLSIKYINKDHEFMKLLE